MSHDDDLLRAIEDMADDDLNASIAEHLGLKTLPSVRGVLTRLQKDGAVTKSEPLENPDDTGAKIHRVYIKPVNASALSVTAPSAHRAVRVALLVWLRLDKAAPPVIRKALRA